MSPIQAQQRFALSKVAANWHELMILCCVMWPSIVCTGKQLSPCCSQKT